MDAFTCEIDRRARDFFDALAPEWDAKTCPEHRVRLAAILQELPIAPEAWILDVGCGNGVLWPMLSPRLGPQGRIVAIDVSGAMLKAAQARHGTAQTLWIQADAATPSLTAGCFDAILCNSVFPHFADQALVMRELASLLKLGGWLAVCHSQSREAINAFHRKVGGLVGGHELPAETEMRRLSEQAGLHVDRLEDLDDRYLMLAKKQS